MLICCILLRMALLGDDGRLCYGLGQITGKVGMYKERAYVSIWEKIQSVLDQF